MLNTGRANRSRPTAAKSKKHPRLLGAALNEFVQELGITRKLSEYAVITSWSEIVGSQIAKVTVARRIEKGTLFVAVSSYPWRAELTMRRREMIEKINRFLGKKVVEDIRFR